MRLRVLAPVALFLLMAPPLQGQDPAVRATLESLITELGAAGESVPAPDQLCPGATGNLQRACDGFAAARRAELAPNAADAIRARDLFERVVQDEPNWSVAWYGLGIARLQAARAGVVSRSGPRLPVGVSNETGAAAALMRALELDSTSWRAANALARAPLGREGISRGRERLPFLRHAYPMLSPPAIHAAALLEYNGGSADTAVAWLDALRAAAVFPVGLTDHLLAKALHRAGNAKRSHEVFLRGVEDTSAISQATYRQEVAWIARAEELTEWDSLPPVARARWMREFWARRDIEGGFPEGARLEEHLRRLDYVTEHYAATLPRSGRNRAAGGSATIDPYPEEVVAAFFKERPFFSGGDTAITREANEVAAAVLRRESERRVVGGDQAFQLLNTSLGQLDDRGVMYLRHGPPDKLAKTTGGEAVELWLYDLPTGPRFLAFKEVNFDGQSGASQLVPTLLSSSIVVRNQVCHLKASLCTGDADPRGANVSVGVGNPTADCPPTDAGCATAEDRLARVTGVRVEGMERVAAEANRKVSGAQLRREREEGEATIAVLAATDQYRPTFTEYVNARAQVVGLRDPVGGGTYAVAAIALAGDQLFKLEGVLPDGRSVYRLRLQLQAVRRADGVRFELDTVRVFASAAPLRSGQYLAIVMTLPLPPGGYSASVRVSQDDGRGVVATLSRLHILDAAPRLEISDLVLGRDKGGAKWRHSSGEVLLNPLNSFKRDERASLYYQLTGLVAGETYSHRLELYRGDDKPGGKPRLAIQFQTTAAADHAEVERDVELKSLDTGTYRVRLVVSHGTTEVEALSWVRVVK